MFKAVLFCLVAISLVLGSSALSAAGAHPSPLTHPGVPNCTVKWHRQFLDNFGWQNTTFLERYLVFDKYYKPGGPIFFYTGNEDTIILYANTCGLMWENAEKFNAALVFAEHRYFGESLPCPGGFRECGNYLGTDQAMADYANLIRKLRTEDYPEASAVITFGGSYGGMLSAWMRMRYPALVDGSIASSAPIGCLSPDYKGESYWAVVTRDATSAGGSAPNCSANVNAAIRDVKNMMQTEHGRADLVSILGLCGSLQADDTEQLLLFIQAAFDSMAMGDYPYPTYYISGDPAHPAPAWPMREACKFMANEAPTPFERVAMLKQAISVVDNITQSVQCYNISGLNPSVYSPIWDFMVCTEQIINEQPYFAATGWPNDMFWEQPKYTKAKINAHCDKFWGKTPRYGFLNAELGIDAIPASSNIVFANGGLDPWHSGGILTNISDSLVALMVPDGGHHLDLFFSNPADPASVIEVRKTQLANIQKWIEEAKAKKKH